jgi:glutathione S-transferase
MITLYYKPTCPFCRRVQAVIDRLQLEVDLKDTSDSVIEAELVALGGQAMVPYMVDAELGVEMYESDDIVGHLQSNYGKVSAALARPKMHIGDNVCISCEG